MSVVGYMGQLLVGIAFFLLGSNFLEDALHRLAGRSFKLFLRRHTDHKLEAIGGSAIVTGMLQSSSVVNLFVLSLVGAGIIQLENALAITLGTNLGTTFDSWLVATIGFNANITIITSLTGGIAGIAIAFLNPSGRVYTWTKFIFGFSLLFIGLGLIRTGMGDMIIELDTASFSNWPLIALVMLGFIVTSLIQSSSAMMALALSALYAGAITLPAAMCVVLGSEIGSAVKLFLAAARGSHVKKQLAAGNFIINLTTACIVLLAFRYFYQLTISIVGSGRDLTSLVFFQTLVNLTALVFFYPFLKPLAKLLARKIRPNTGEQFINKVEPAASMLAQEALENEITSFIQRVLRLGNEAFHTHVAVEQEYDHPKKSGNAEPLEEYEDLKKYHGEIHNYYLAIKDKSGNGVSQQRLEQLIAAVRYAMYAAKSLKDVFSDIDQLRNSSKDAKYQEYRKEKSRFSTFASGFSLLMKETNDPVRYNRIIQLKQNVNTSYTLSIRSLYQSGNIETLDEGEISTLLNFNREMYHFYDSLILSGKELLLNARDSERFDEWTETSE